MINTDADTLFKTHELFSEVLYLFEINLNIWKLQDYSAWNILHLLKMWNMPEIETCIDLYSLKSYVTISQVLSDSFDNVKL